MKKIYNDLKDLQVRNYVVYAKTADHKLYYDAAYTTQVTADDLKDAFVKGALILFDGTNYMVPIEFASSKVKTIGTVSSAIAFVEWAAKA